MHINLELDLIFGVKIVSSLDTDSELLVIHQKPSLKSNARSEQSHILMSRELTACLCPLAAYRDTRFRMMGWQTAPYMLSANLKHMSTMQIKVTHWFVFFACHTALSEDLNRCVSTQRQVEGGSM